MSLKEVKGYLANDGTFFRGRSECERYNAMNELQISCETHGVNFEFFIDCLNAWHKQIREYLDADSRCETKQANGAALREPEGYVEAEVPSVDGYPANLEGRDKDAPGFLEQQIRGPK